MKRKVMITIFSFILLVGLGTLDSIVAAEPYHLGVDLAITGTGALYCTDAVDAIKLAVGEINAGPFDVLAILAWPSNRSVRNTRSCISPPSVTRKT